MSPQRHPIELMDIVDEADAIATDFLGAMQRSDLHTMRDCFTRLTRNHEKLAHVTIELCEEVANMKGEEPCLT
jgi:hypothetical protein